LGVTVFAALFIFAAIAFGVFIAIVVVVSVCSRLEDSQWTLSGPPPGPMRALARRIVGFHARDFKWHTRSVDWPEPATPDWDLAREGTPTYDEAPPPSAEPKWPTSAPM
jgi:hypothetical protein